MYLYLILYITKFRQKNIIFQNIHLPFHPCHHYTILYEAELFSGAIGYITNMAPSFSSSLVKVRDGSGPFFCPRVGDMGFEISLGSSCDSMTFGSRQAQVNKILFGF